MRIAKAGFYVLMCSLCSLRADVEFRSSWQGHYTHKAHKDYTIAIKSCANNLCTLIITKDTKDPTPKPIYQATLRLLDYTRAEVDSACDFALETHLLESSELQIPLHLAITKNTCLQEAPLQVSPHSNKKSNMWERVVVYPSFDCAKARTNNERSICASTSLTTPLQDIVLNDIYALLLQSLPKQARKSLKASQKQWLSELMLCDGDEQCIAQGYKARIFELENLYASYL